MMLLSSALVCIFFSFINQIESLEKCNCTKVNMFVGDSKLMNTRDVQGKTYKAVASTYYPNVESISSVKVKHSKQMNNTINITIHNYDANGKQIKCPIKLQGTSKLGEKCHPYILSSEFSAFYIISCAGNLYAEYICQKAGLGGPYPQIIIFALRSDKVSDQDVQTCLLLTQERLGQDHTFYMLNDPPENSNCCC